MKIINENLIMSTSQLRKALGIGFSAAALVLFATSASASEFVANGSFEVNGGAGQIGYNTTATGWTVGSGGYTFLYAPGTADNLSTTAIGQYGSNPLWGPQDGSANGLPATSPDGGYYAALDGDFQQAPLYQTITGLTAGQKYDLTFYWAASQQYGFDGPTVQAMNVCLGSSAESYVDSGSQPLSGGTNASSNLSCSGSGASTAIYNLSNHAFSGWQAESFNLTANNSTEVLSFLAYGNLQYPPFALLDGVSLTGGSTVPEPGTLPLLFTGMMSGLAVLRAKKRFIR